MSKVKLPADVEAALEDLDKIILESKNVPLKENFIMVDKNTLREIHTKISREKNRIQELKNEYLMDAGETGETIIADAKLKATQILEAAVSEAQLESDVNIKVALEIKNNALDYLEQTLNRFHRIMSDYDELFSEVKNHVGELDNKKM